MAAGERAASGLRFRTPLSLPRAGRLRRRAEYQRVYSKGKRTLGRFLVVFGEPRADGGDGSRLGITASRRVGGAVVRSRCRRRIRELYRLHPEALADLNIDLVINARRGCAGAPWVELRADYLACLQKLRQRLTDG